MLNVMFKVVVWCLEDFLIKIIQMVNEFYGDVGGYYLVGVGFYCGGCIGIDYDGVVRMGVVKGVEFFNWIVQI